MSPTINYVIPALGSALAYGVTYLFSKRLTHLMQDSFRVVWQTNCFLVVVCLCTVLLTQQWQSVSLHALFWIMLNGIVGMFALVSLFEGLKRSKVALVVTAANTYPLVAYVLSLVFLDIPTSLVSLIGIVIIIVGLALLNLGDLRRLRLNEGVLFGLGTAVGWGIFAFMIRFVGEGGVNPFMTIFLIEMGVLVALGIFLLITRRSLRLEYGRKMGLAFGSGGTMGVGAILYSVALQLGPPAIVASLESTSVLLSMILAFLIFKERMKVYQIFAIVVVLLGVMILITQK